MHWADLLAQALPEVSEKTVDRIISGLMGLIAGGIPSLIMLWKARAEIKVTDRQLTAQEQQQLIQDLRLEREAVRAECKKEKEKWLEELSNVHKNYQQELALLRAEHEECLKVSARQEQMIINLQGDIDDLQRRLAEFQKRLDDLSDTPKED